MSRSRNNTAKLDALLASVTKDVLGGDDLQQLQEQGIRVERILLELVRPDPVQPRRVLPEPIHLAFHSNRLTPTQALRELVQIVQVTARQHGRPFNSVLELLPDPDHEHTNMVEIQLSPEEHLLHDLVNLAITLRDDGQVNPLTVIDMSQGVTRQFRIETGERRYWANWLLRDFIANYTGDGMIPCIIVASGAASPFRQAKENTSRAGLNAVAMARQVALLLLHVHEIPIPDGPVSHDFYRQALELDLRGKREFTDIVYSALGGMSKQRFQQYKALLKLCDEALEIADRHNLDEGRLHYVLQLDDPEHQVELLQQMIQRHLTVRQVKEIVEKGQDNLTNSEDDLPLLPRSAIQMAKLALKPDQAVNGYRIAEAALTLEKDRSVAKARIRGLRDLLEEAERYVDEIEFDGS